MAIGAVALFFLCVSSIFYLLYQKSIPIWFQKRWPRFDGKRKAQVYASLSPEGDFEVSTFRVIFYLQDVCPICMEDLGITSQNQEPLLNKRKVLQTPCRHIFHEDCLRAWMRNRDQCPTCRTILPSISENEP